MSPDSTAKRREYLNLGPNLALFFCLVLFCFNVVVVVFFGFFSESVIGSKRLTQVQSGWRLEGGANFKTH